MRTTMARRVTAVAVALLATGLLAAACTTGVEPAPSGRQGHCDVLAGARQTVDYHLSVLLAADDPDELAELTRGHDAPFELDATAFRGAVEALAALSGAQGEVDRLRRISGLLEEHLGVEDPFREGSSTGEQLAALTERVYADVQLGLDAAFRAAGCPA